MCQSNLDSRLITLVLALFFSATVGAQNYDYRYFDWGETPKRDNYEYMALQMALEKTRSSHGEFSLERVVRSVSRKRAMREINVGKIINVRPGPWLKGDNENRPEAEINLPVEIPIMQSLLGYRRLIVRKEDLPVFNKITSKLELQRLVAGQGQGWVDMFIYNHNKFSASDSAEVVENLVPMLAKQRFDYVPMSVVEIDSLINRAGDIQNLVAEAPNITLYYPLPVIFYVSINRPELAERLQRGLTLASEDGSMEALLRKQFAAEIAKLESPHNRFIVLENPFLPKAARVPPPIFDKSIDQELPGKPKFKP
ncbi:hypothetical protein P886_0439 [Alteromonadaceae bacterium 2753L.S.0a.02]|nr:hypothetical protein P886_0439 [Alteromonadaceae bacterium 2753L.S.0a.02]